MTLKFLITGATGGFGKEVLRHFINHVPPSDFAAASSKPSNESVFTDQGIAFRHIDYNDPQSLMTGLAGVESLLFVSSFGSNRLAQHSRLITAAQKAGVKHIWYTSLAFGGLGNNAKSHVQADHVRTEQLLKECNIPYTSIREGIYTEAFSVFLDWYPEATSLILPADGEIAYTLRANLGEATARIMIRGGYVNQIVIFTAQETINAQQVVEIINQTTDRHLELDIVSREQYVRLASARDLRGKSKEHFELIATIWDDVAEGALSTTSPLMHEILGREPTRPRDAIKTILEGNRDYTFP